MAHGDITKFQYLIAPNITAKATYTYYFATAVPTYLNGQNDPGYFTRSGTGPYTYAQYKYSTADFFNASAMASGFITSAIAGVQSVAGTAIKAGTSTSADIVITGFNSNLYTQVGSNWAQAQAHTQLPVTAYGSVASDMTLTSAAFSPGQPAKYFVTHEFNHALGLVDASTLVGHGWQSSDDSAMYSIMSYNVQSSLMRNPTELQIYDVAAFQGIYGANNAINATATTYSNFHETIGGSSVSRMFSIWDGGGTDTISAASEGTSSLIDLRPGYFSSLGPEAGVAVSTTSGASPSITNAGTLNVSIAFGSYIENAIGSAKSDLLIGNMLSNNLSGGAGDDIIYGEGLSSIYDSGYGDYRQISSTATNKLGTVSSAVSAYVSDPTKQADIISGGDGNDYIYGSRGNDRLDGGNGHDWLEGGAGRDILIGGSGDDQIFGGIGNDLLDTGSATNWTSAPLVNGERLEGGDGNDIIIMRDSYEVANGGPGADQFWVYRGGQALGGFFGNVVSHQIEDSDPNDSLYWNGYRITGGHAVVLDAERNQDGSFTTTAGWVDDKGIAYTLSGDFLKITLPDKSVIGVSAWASGDMGISFDRSYSDYHLINSDPQNPQFDIPYSGMAWSGQWLDYQNLTGASASLASYGPYNAPTEPLV